VGKAFAAELQSLGRLYDWAVCAPIESLTAAVAELANCSLLAIGSGGSLTAAHFMAKLHEEFTGRVSKHVTPMEAVASAVSHNVAVALLTARGNNKDILDVFRRMVAHEPHSLLVICASQASPISKIAGQFKWTKVVDYALPTGRDGFLATNSLLAFMVLLLRAYNGAFQGGCQPPVDLLREYSPSTAPFIEDVEREQMSRVLQQPVICVLYGGWAHSAALDLESKFTEAALGNMQIADYRNFAHGRHYWLAKRAQESGVIAFVTPECRDLAEKTLAALPRSIPVARLGTDFFGPVGVIDLLISVFHLTRIAGEASNVDPGRPRVPQFGRRIYNIGLGSYLKADKGTLPNWHRGDLLLSRKFAAFHRLPHFGLLGRSLRDALNAYLLRMSEALFAGVVFDYDGTLCSPAERFGTPPEEVITECVRLLSSGILLGVATGRGQSVRESLRKCFPAELWSRVIVGYYSGGDIARLNEEAPDPGRSPDPDILVLHQSALKSPVLSRISRKIEPRPLQLTIEPVAPFLLPLAYSAVRELVRQSHQTGLNVLLSGHSVDVLSPLASKRKVVEFIRTEAGDTNASVLCIGDKGTWWGNDFDLLTEEYALSVDECPLNPNVGWNIAREGHRGIQATVDYLKAMVIKDNRAWLDLRKLGVGSP